MKIHTYVLALLTLFGTMQSGTLSIDWYPSVIPISKISLIPPDVLAFQSPLTDVETISLHYAKQWKMFDPKKKIVISYNFLIRNITQQYKKSLKKELKSISLHNNPEEKAKHEKIAATWFMEFIRIMYEYTVNEARLPFILSNEHYKEAMDRTLKEIASTIYSSKTSKHSVHIHKILEHLKTINLDSYWEKYIYTPTRVSLLQKDVEIKCIENLRSDFVDYIRNHIAAEN
jgi:hypothetical protein